MNTVTALGEAPPLVVLSYAAGASEIPAFAKPKRDVSTVVDQQRNRRTERWFPAKSRKAVEISRLSSATMGEASCVCPNDSYLTSDLDGATAASLGPAYEDYKNGDVHIRTTWEQDRRVTPYYLPECCTKLKPDFTFDPLWLDHAIVLAFFIATCLVLLGIFIVLRNEQPFKFRDVRAVTLRIVGLIVIFILAVVSGNEGGTSHPVPGVVMFFTAGPIINYFFILKDIQLYYILAWGEAKLHKNNYERIQQFYRYRFLLDFRFYLGGFIAMLVFTGIPAIYALTARDTFKHAMSSNNFDTIRCEWYHIPEEYQQPKTDSLLCECVKSNFDIPGETNFALCYQAYTNKCVLGSADDDDGPNDEFCDACANAFATLDLTDTECTTYFTEFVLEGNCGFPSMTPKASTCTTSVFADHAMSYTCGAVSYFFTFLNLLALIPLIGKRDDYGMVFENVLCSSINFVLFFLSSGDLFGKSFLGWYYEDLGFKYRAPFLSTFIACWNAALCTLGIPLVMYLYRTKWWSPLSSEHLKTSRVQQPSAVRLVTSGVETVERVDVGSMLQVKRPRTDFEEAVQECVSQPALLEIYAEYAVEAFHVENVRFLEETHLFFKMVESNSDMTDLCVKATQICEQFVSSTAAFQVNLPAKLRLGVEKNLDTLVKLMTPESNGAKEEEQETTPSKKLELKASRAAAIQYDALDALVEALAQAYLEVRGLLVKDTWPRFRASRYFARYQAVQRELREQEERLTAAFSSLGAATNRLTSSIRGTSDTGTPSPRHSQSPSAHTSTAHPPSVSVAKSSRSESEIFGRSEDLSGMGDDML